MEAPVWTPQLVEELMFREFIKKEDVSGLLPPPPSVSTQPYLERYESTTKVLYSYIRNGPLTALSSMNVNSTAAGKHFNHFTATNPASRTPPVKVTEAPRSHRPPTPKAPSRTASLHKTDCVSSSLYTKGKRQRIEWPKDVPTNEHLKTNSRSKVAPLTAKRCAAQEGVDPDFIFAQNPGELPLSHIFAAYPKALRSVQSVRNASGDWQNDTFTREEEKRYKFELGYSVPGPSQCVSEN